MSDGVRSQHLLRERVAEEVRALLARKMMTGAELAASIGKSPMYVSRRVRGEVAFDLDDIERIAQVLDVQISDLMPKPDEVLSPKGRSVHLPRPVSALPVTGPTGQKPRAIPRPASAKRRPTLIGPGRRTS